VRRSVGICNRVTRDQTERPECSFRRVACCNRPQCAHDDVASGAGPTLGQGRAQRTYLDHIERRHPGLIETRVLQACTSRCLHGIVPHREVERADLLAGPSPEAQVVRGVSGELRLHCTGVPALEGSEGPAVLPALHHSATHGPGVLRLPAQRRCSVSFPRAQHANARGNSQAEVATGARR